MWPSIKESSYTLALPTVELHKDIFQGLGPDVEKENIEFGDGLNKTVDILSGDIDLDETVNPFHHIESGGSQRQYRSAAFPRPDHKAPAAGVFQAADILLMPSDSEGLPMTLLEAMACGLPVVATSVGGIPEVITDGFTGRLIPVDDPAALTKTIDDLLGNESMRHEIGRAARGVIEEGYGIEKVAEKLRELYSGVLVNEGCS